MIGRAEGGKEEGGERDREGEGRKWRGRGEEGGRGKFYVCVVSEAH